MKSIGGTRKLTYWFLPLLQPVQTEVALLHGTILAELGYAKGTGREARVAANALIPINQYNAVCSPLADSSRRAYFLTGWFSTMHAGKREINNFDIREFTTYCLYYPPSPRACLTRYLGLKPMPLFAGNLTRLTARASI